MLIFFRATLGSYFSRRSHMFIQKCLTTATAFWVLAFILTGCTSDPTVSEVTSEAAAAAKAFAAGKDSYEPSNKKISVTARADQQLDQQTGQSFKVIRLHAENLKPKKRSIMFNSNIPADMFAKDNKDLAKDMALIQESFAGIAACAGEYDNKSSQAGKVSNPLAEKKESDTGCRWSGLTYNDQPAVDISSEKNRGVYLRLVEVRDNKYTQK